MADSTRTRHRSEGFSRSGVGERGRGDVDSECLGLDTEARTMTDSEQVLPDVRTAPLNELARQASSIGLPCVLRKVPGR